MWIRSLRRSDCDANDSGDPMACYCGSDERCHAKRTAPECFVHVGRSCIKGAGLGVWATAEIPVGAIFGPYGGELIPLDGLTEADLKMVRAT